MTASFAPIRPLAAACLSLGLLAGAALAAPEPNAQTPLFEAVDTEGRTVDLEALRGKIVVLEWTNHLCPFVRKHYGAGNMQALQQEAAEAGAVWISIISSAPGRQGHVDAATADALMTDRGASPAHVVLDESGAIGKLYRARTTPQMFVIDPEGRVAYMGGVDDIPSANPDDIDLAKNFVREALQAVVAGEKPEVQTARPYGCSVKYGS